MKKFTVTITPHKDDVFEWKISDALELQSFYLFCIAVTKGLATNKFTTDDWGDTDYSCENSINDSIAIGICEQRLSELYEIISNERDSFENEIIPLL